MSPDRLALVELAADVFGVLGHGGMPNAAFVITDLGVVCIDSLYSPAFAVELRHHIKSVTPLEIIAVVNTHHHADHVFGNQTLGSARVIAHENARSDLAVLADDYVEGVRTRRPDLADELVGTEIVLPNETFTGSLVLRIGGLELRLVHYGRIAHTRGDLVVQLPDRGVVIAGDLVFNGVTPPMRDGDITGLRETLELLGADAVGSTLVPGHGRVADSSCVATQLARIDAVFGAVVQAPDADASELLKRLPKWVVDEPFAADRLPDWLRKAQQAIWPGPA